MDSLLASLPCVGIQGGKLALTSLAALFKLSGRNSVRVGWLSACLRVDEFVPNVSAFVREYISKVLHIFPWPAGGRYPAC